MSKRPPINETELIKSIVKSEDINDNIKDEALERVIKTEEDGVMDKIFGKKHPQAYIALVVIIILVLMTGFLTTVYKSDLQFVKGMWQIMIPAITTIIGYMFGKLN